MRDVVTTNMAGTGFHEGELAMQRRAGVEAEAGRLESMLDSSALSQGAARFLASQRFAALTGRDRNGVLWVSPLAAPPGFLRGHDRVLHVSASPRVGDPLHEIQTGQQVGLIAIDFATRRRLRINGELVGADHASMTVRIGQSYGNCPRYIHRRAIDVAGLAAAPSKRPGRATLLDPADQALIETSDRFFLGTTHPTRGSDASHRGGPPGFVRVDSPNRLWWPDFPGNNMFNSHGNLAVNDEAALLFLDFDTGAALHVSGTAHVQWTTPAATATDGAAGRNVAFSVGAVATLTRSSDAKAARSLKWA